MKKCLERMDRSAALLLLVSLVLALVFLLFASPFTTPLNGYYGYDSAVFMTIGKGIAEGKLPYLDLYDNKGPMIFYINALGYLLGGRGGVFALQVLFMGAAFFLTYRLARLFTEKGGAWLSLLLLVFFYCGCVGEGNMTEEWSLVFSLLPLYLALRFGKSGAPNAEHPFGYSLVYGLCAGVQLMFRVTNAAIVAGIVLAYAFALLREKEWAALGKNALAVLLGAAAVILPFVLYFRSIGAFDYFLYASLLHNFAYAADGAAGKTLADWLTVLAKISAVPVILVVGLYLRRKGRMNGAVCRILCFAGVLTALSTCLGYTYKHYFLLLAPVVIAGFATLWEGIRGSESIRRGKALIAVLFLLFIAPFSVQSAIHAGKSILFNFMHSMDGEKIAMENVGSYITSDRDSVLAYDLRANVYLYMDVVPCFRHFMTQSWQALGSPFIEDELEELFTEDPPVWIITDSSEETAARLDERGYEEVPMTGSVRGMVLYHHTAP